LELSGLDIFDLNVHTTLADSEKHLLLKYWSLKLAARDLLLRFVPPVAQLVHNYMTIAICQNRQLLAIDYGNNEADSVVRV